MPTGGVIQYDYNTSVSWTETSSGSIYEGGSVVTLPAANMYTLTRSLKERRQYLGGTLTGKTDYVNGNEIDNYDGAGNLLAKQTYTITNSGTAPNSGTNYNSWQYNQTSASTYYDKNGTTVLESVATTYTQNSCQVNCSTVQTVTTTMNGLSKQTSYTYDQYNNVTDEKDYDWSTGTPSTVLREVQTSYVTGSSYTNLNILNLPSSTKVLSATGTTPVYTVYNYDEYQYRPLQNDPGIGGHDSNYNTGYGTRGNLTTIWRSDNGTSVSFTGAQYTVDIAGQHSRSIRRQWQ